MVAGAVGSLGPDDLSEIGVRAVAVDVLELAMGAGLQRVANLGGIGSYLGWDGRILAVARWSTAPPLSPGWRGRALPRLERKRESRLLLRSAVDGALTEVDLEELARVVAGLGAQPSADLVPGGSPVVWWNDADGGAPPGPCVVTALAQEEAARGRYRAGRGWRDLVVVRASGRGLRLPCLFPCQPGSTAAPLAQPRDHCRAHALLAQLAQPVSGS